MESQRVQIYQKIDLLSPEDEIGVIAVDSTAHIITPLATVANNNGQRGRILKIESMGGGIFIYEALKAATRMLLKAEAETRHIINYSGVIIENVPANEIGSRGMEMLAAWVEDSGSGLMMTGGKNSFGPGGYFRSPLEPILPISMELKKEHRKFNLAIAVVMDRSGSMGASAGQGKTKMDLANIGTVQVMDQFPPNCIS